METVRETVRENERELVAEKELVGDTVRVPVMEKVLEMEMEGVAAAAVVVMLTETPEPVEMDRLELIPAEPAEVERLRDNPPLAPAVEAERLLDRPAVEAEKLIEEVPEQSLRARELTLSLKTRVGPPAPVGENVPIGTASTSAGEEQAF